MFLAGGVHAKKNGTDLGIAVFEREITMAAALATKVAHLASDPNFGKAPSKLLPDGFRAEFADSPDIGFLRRCVHGRS